MAESATRSTIVGGTLALVGTLSGYALSWYQTTLSHQEKTQAAFSDQVRQFAEATKDAGPTLQSGNDESVALSLTMLFELADSATNASQRIKEKTYVIVLGGTFERHAVQVKMLSIYRVDREAQDILNTSAYGAALALDNTVQPSKSSTFTDVTPQATVIPNVSVVNRPPLVNDGWIYLGRGTTNSHGSVTTLNIYSNIVGPAGFVPLPTGGDTAVLAHDVNFRADEPGGDLRLAPLVGALKAGQRVRLLAPPRDYKYSSLTSVEWAHVTLVQP